MSTWSAEVSTWSAEVSTWSATSVWHVDGRTSPAAGASGDRVVETAERYSRGGGRLRTVRATGSARRSFFLRVRHDGPGPGRTARCPAPASVAPHSGYKFTVTNDRAQSILRFGLENRHTVLAVTTSLVRSAWTR